MTAELNTTEPVVVLLVEDNLDHAELIKRSFAAQHVPSRIYHVTNGESALDFLYHRGIYADREHSPAPRMILLDMRLPKIAGIELLGKIKNDQDLKKIPVIIISTSHAEEEVQHAYENYANGYLVKPGDFIELIEMMDSFCTYWLNWNYYPW